MTCTPPAHQGWLLTLAAVLPLVAGRTLLPTLAADGVTGHARGAGARLPAAWPKEARLALCRGRGKRGLQVSAGPEALPPQLCTHRPGTARPRSPPCRRSCRPSCHTRACSAAHTGTPPSSPARRPTEGRLHPRTNREGPAPCGHPPSPAQGLRDPTQSRWFVSIPQMRNRVSERHFPARKRAGPHCLPHTILLQRAARMKSACL